MKNINSDNWTMFKRYELDSPYLDLYDQEFEHLCSLYPDLDFKYGYSIDELYYIGESMSAKNKSTYLFPGDTVYFYPVIKILKAHKMHTCALSGALIYPGSEYIQYKAFLYNKTKHKSYIMSHFDIEAGANFSFPMTLEVFEFFYYRLNASYDCSLETEYNILTAIHEPLIRTLRKNK